MRRFVTARVALAFALALIASPASSVVAPADAAPPSIVGISPTNGPTVGGFPITIFGSDFAADAGSVTVGGTNAEVTDWGLSRIICTCPEGDPGARDVVVLSSAGESSPPALFTFDSPSISLVTPGVSPAAGGVLITITGQDFGRAAAPATVIFGGAPGSNVQHLSHGMITCVTPAGTANTRVGLQVAVSGQMSNSVAFDFDPPQVSSIIPPNAPTAGGTVITIVGDNFGPDASVTIRNKPASCSNRQKTMLVCTTPEDDPGAAELVVFAGSTSSAPKLFTYDSPVIAFIEPSTLPAAGGVHITVHGLNFGTESAQRSTTVGGVHVGELSYGGHSSFVVDGLPGVPGGTEPLCLELPGVSEVCYPIKWMPPEVLSVTPNMGPISGGTVITIRGENFGILPAYTRSVSFGGASAADVQCPNDSIMTCTLPQAAMGASGPVDVIVSVEGAPDTVATGFEYLATTGVAPGDPARPVAFAVRQNAPNPFSARTAIAFELPEAGDYSVSIFDIRGRLVRRYEGSSGSGTMILNWNGVDASGVPSPAGVYFYRVRAGRFDETRRMLLVK
jgi:hypothetical protein